MTQKKRGLKHIVPFSKKKKKKIYDSFKGYSKKTKIQTSKMLDEAIEDCLKKHEIKY